MVHTMCNELCICCYIFNYEFGFLNENFCEACIPTEQFTERFVFGEVA